MSQNQMKALRAIADGIIQACKAAGPLGAPGGHIYAALMSQGCTLEQYNGIMAGIVGTGMLEKRGECYVATGKELAL